MGELNLREYTWDIISLYFILFFLSAKLAQVVVGDVGVEMSSISDVLRHVLLPLAVLVILHEGLHAVAFKLLGARVKFGVAMVTKIDIAPYVSTNMKIKARDFIKATLAPLFILSPITLILAKLFNSFFWAFIFVLNTAGSVGDIIVALTLMKMPKDALIWDEGTVMVSTHDFPRPYPRIVSTALKLGLIGLVVIFISNVEFVVVYSNG
ncbi:membrane-associated metallopeptidase [Thermococcus chitonophagus]|uniref:Membrane-associated metallopeptidase n=1 Tax=Thermococcus chitonophagus TaxID=54262 RepID=A0A160VRD6_9EURY|nr:DUF3267 domain-containing protein [Thermococcus chitonophagus]ASJ16559.1 membrane-associated metallopeptidase [Thermococcus chitonophagus]CUX77533.1 hypothetical protein CHITON_0754 [Thermococcus chitonophagus]